MSEEDIIYGLIRKDCEAKGFIPEVKIQQMGLILNIHHDKIQKATERLIEDKKIRKINGNYFVVG